MEILIYKHIVMLHWIRAGKTWKYLIFLLSLDITSLTNAAEES